LQLLCNFLSVRRALTTFQKGSLSSKDAKQQRQRKPSNNDAKMQFHVRICHTMSGETDTKHYG